MKYPNILFFRDEAYAEIDTFLTENKDKLNCTVNVTSDPGDVLKLFDSNYHIFITYGNDVGEYYGRLHNHIVNRMRLKWIHFDKIDIDAFNHGVNYCYIHNVLIEHETTRPVFSAFTTCYNSYHKFLRPYTSLKKQSMRDWEWVVLDDSPDDKHFEFLKSLVGNDSRVRLYRRSCNSGNIGNVKNESVSLCRGRYVLELDHDDEILPDCLKDAVSAFETDPEVGFVYMDGAHLYENRTPHTYGDHFGLGHCAYYCQKFNEVWVNVISSANINNITLSHIVALPNHPRIWKRSTLLELGNYSEFLPICDDQELIMRTAVKTKIARVHKLAYIQYMNDGWNNFSLIRNSEINRLGPQFIVPQAFNYHKIDERMKELGSFEPVCPESWSRMWKRDNFTYVYCNSVLNFDHTKQYCILGYKTLIDNIETIRELYGNDKNDFIVLENGMSKEDLCGLLDGLNLSRMKCYAMTDCTWDELRKYFFLTYKSTESYEIIDSDRTPRTTSWEQQDEIVQECSAGITFDQLSESPAQE
jgi:glycosyltransferase involved in cell wall biosynthesis